MQYKGVKKVPKVFYLNSSNRIFSHIHGTMKNSLIKVKDAFKTETFLRGRHFSAIE